DGDPVDRGHGDVHRRRLRPDPPGDDLGGTMQTLRVVLAALLVTLALPGAVPAQDTSWPREVTFALLSTENAADITRRWGSILAHLEKDLGVKVKAATA